MPRNALLLSVKGFSIVRETGNTLPSVPFLKIKQAILGSKYDLTLAFVTEDHGKKLHKQWKADKDPLNILSFPYSKSEGEIVMTLSAVRREAKKFNLTYHQHLTFLFIHGCVHLLGHDHSPAMEKLEGKFLKKFKTPNPYEHESHSA